MAGLVQVVEEAEALERARTGVCRPSPAAAGRLSRPERIDPTRSPVLVGGGGWVNGWVNGPVNGWVNGWLNAMMGGWVGGWVGECACVLQCVCDCM